MTEALLESVPMIVTNIALARVAWVLVGHARTFRNRRRHVQIRFSMVEVATAPEPFVLAVMAVNLGSFERVVGVAGPRPALALAASVAGLAVSLWAFASFPRVGTGHYVDVDQQIVTRGIYGWIRHPIYLGVFLMWIGFALGCASAAAWTVTLVYVVPVYLLYMRAEEEMMISHFGAHYRRYRTRVGGLLPKLRHA